MIKTVTGDVFFQKYESPLFSGYDKEREQIDKIVKDVQTRGDEALKDYTERFDGIRPAAFPVEEEEITAAARLLEPALKDAVREACGNVAEYHRKQLPASYWQPEEGLLRGVLHRPYDRAGIYVPGGTAAYPSSVMMTVVPARVAGVEEIILCTPPAADGNINPLTLFTAREAGATRIFRVGGAQAVAAMAYGTETIPPVQVITGPGNIYVTLAKKQVYGDVGIDMLAGPSEIMVVAAADKRADFIAADLLSQAEHDALSRVFLVTMSSALAEETCTETEKQLRALPRREIAEKVLKNNSWIILVDSLEQAWDVVNLVAPEHLELHLPDAWQYLSRIKNAASIFLGEYSPEPLADYMAGLNHVLPTGGAARFSSPLGVCNYMKYSQVMAYSAPALKKKVPGISRLARVEGLEAHARAAEIRFEKQ